MDGNITVTLEQLQALQIGYKILWLRYSMLDLNGE